MTLWQISILAFHRKKSEHPLDHTPLGELGLSVTISAIGRQGRTAETSGTIHFLYIKFLQTGQKERAEGGNGSRGKERLGLKARNGEWGDERIQGCNNAVVTDTFMKLLVFLQEYIGNFLHL